MHIKVLIMIIAEKMDFFLHWGFLYYDKKLTVWIDFLSTLLQTAALLSFGQGVLAPKFLSETLSSSIFSRH